MLCSILASVVDVVVKHVLILFFVTRVSLFTYYQFLMPSSEAVPVDVDVHVKTIV